MRVRCRKCHSIVALADVDLEQARVDCSECGALFSTPLEEADVPRPDTMTVHSKAGALRITYKEAFSRLMVLVLVLTSLVLVAQLISLFTEIGKDVEQPLYARVSMAIGPVLTALLGWCYALARLLNRTTVYVRGGVLAVRQRPIQATRDKEVSLSTIRELYANPVHRGGKPENRSYVLCAVTTDAGEKELIKDLPAPEALFLLRRLDESVRARVPNQQSAP